MLKITTTLTFALLTAAVLMTGCKSSDNIKQDTEQSKATPAVSPDGNARAEAYLNDSGREIRMAIKNGEMTEEEGRLKYAAIAKRVEKRMAGAKPKTADTDVRARYKEAVDRMAEMVKAGEITREQMQTRLDGMKKRMGADKSKKISKEDYDLAASKMARMVKAGEITREQMQARLDGMKKRISGDDREEASDRREEVSDDCMALRRRLGEAVRNGDMTREEAGKIWKEEGC